MLLYPQRRRCRACRRYFGFAVVLRMYCSQQCAGTPGLPGVDTLPRSCRVLKFNPIRWEEKKSFLSSRLAEKTARTYRVRAYVCDGPEGCGRFHLSSRPAPRLSA